MDPSRLIKKAQRSTCTYKISAVALDKKGEILGYSTNQPRFSTPGSIRTRGIHSEQILIKKYSDLIKTIVICRVGRNGILRPIDPCPICQRMADKLGIKIITISDYK